MAKADNNTGEQDAKTAEAKAAEKATAEAKAAEKKASEIPPDAAYRITYTEGDRKGDVSYCTSPHTAYEAFTHGADVLHLETKTAPWEQPKPSSGKRG